MKKISLYLLLSIPYFNCFSSYYDAESIDQQYKNDLKKMTEWHAKSRANDYFDPVHRAEEGILSKNDPFLQKQYEEIQHQKNYYNEQGIQYKSQESLLKEAAKRSNSREVKTIVENKHLYATEDGYYKALENALNREKAFISNKKYKAAKDAFKSGHNEFKAEIYENNNFGSRNRNSLERGKNYNNYKAITQSQATSHFAKNLGVGVLQFEAAVFVANFLGNTIWHSLKPEEQETITKEVQKVHDNYLQSENFITGKTKQKEIELNNKLYEYITEKIFGDGQGSASDYDNSYGLANDFDSYGFTKSFASEKNEIAMQEYLNDKNNKIWSKIGNLYKNIHDNSNYIGESLGKAINNLRNNQQDQSNYDGYRDSEVYKNKEQDKQPTIGGILSSYEVNNRKAEESYARLRHLRNKPQLNESQRQELEQLEKEWEHMDQNHFEQKYRKPSSRFSFDKKTGLYVAGALGISSVFYGGYRWYKNRQNRKEQLKKRRELRSKKKHQINKYIK